jgi:hypothetical protein
MSETFVPAFGAVPPREQVRSAIARVRALATRRVFSEKQTNDLLLVCWELSRYVTGQGPPDDVELKFWEAVYLAVVSRDTRDALVSQEGAAERQVSTAEKAATAAVQSRRRMAVALAPSRRVREPGRLVHLSASLGESLVCGLWAAGDAVVGEDAVTERQVTCGACLLVMGTKVAGG